MTNLCLSGSRALLRLSRASSLHRHAQPAKGSRASDPLLQAGGGGVGGGGVVRGTGAWWRVIAESGRAVQSAPPGSPLPLCRPRPTRQLPVCTPY